MIYVLRFCLMLLALLFTGCAAVNGAVAADTAPDPDRGPVYAYVNDRPVYAADITAQINALPYYQRQQLSTQPGGIQAFVDDFLTARLVADEARAQGVESTDTYQRKLATAAEQILLETYMQVLINRVAAPNDSEVEAYYRLNIANFTRPAAVTLMFVQVADSATADRVYAEAQAGADFAALVARSSLAADSVTTLQEGNLPAGLRSTLAATPDSGICPPFATAPGTIYVFKKLSATPAAVVPVDEVRDSARQAAFREKVSLYMQVYLETLKRDHPFRIIGTVPPLAPAAARPAGDDHGN